MPRGDGDWEDEREATRKGKDFLLFLLLFFGLASPMTRKPLMGMSKGTGLSQYAHSSFYSLLF